MPGRCSLDRSLTLILEVTPSRNGGRRRAPSPGPCGLRTFSKRRRPPADSPAISTGLQRAPRWNCSRRAREVVTLCGGERRTPTPHPCGCGALSRRPRRGCPVHSPVVAGGGGLAPHTLAGALSFRDCPGTLVRFTTLEVGGDSPVRTDHGRLAKRTWAPSPIPKFGPDGRT